MVFAEIMSLLIQRHQTTSALVCLAILVLVFYGNTLANGFVQDDVWLIQNNERVRSLANIPQVATGELLINEDTNVAAVYYRLTQGLSYILTHAISGNSAFFHFVNLVYFWGILAALFLFVRELSGKSIAGFFAGILFGMHPIATEVVNWPSAVPELLMTLFVLLSAYFYIRYRHGGQRAHLYLSLVLYILAIFSKEPAILLPLFFVFFDAFIFFPAPRMLFRMREVWRYGIFGAGAAVYFILRFISIGGVSPIVSSFGEFSLADRIFALLTLFAQYLGKLFYPQPLLFFYTFEKRSDLASPDFIFSFVVGAVFCALLAWMLLRRMALVALPLFWFALFISIVVLLPDKLGESVFAERYMFLSTIGFAMFGGYVGSLAWAHSRRAGLVFCGAVALFSIASWFAVFPQNQAWANDDTMYRDTLAKNPRADTMRFNYAVMLRSQGKLEEARGHFAYIADHNSEWPAIAMVYFQLGDYEQEVAKDMEKAMQYYRISLAEAAMQGDWKGSFAAERLGALFVEREEYAKASLFYCQALQLNPAPEAQERMNRTISFLEEEYGQDASARIVRELTDEEVFARNPTSFLRAEERTCDEDACALRFAIDGPSPGIVLPFLIVGIDANDHAVTIQDSAFDPSRGITLYVDTKYKNKDMKFLFPTCEGTYYEVRA